MESEPTDSEGPNLFKVSENLGIQENVFFSRERIGFDKVNMLYNISDFCINISYAEGFGLGTLEAMMTGTPIVAAMTGGMTRQVVDFRDGSENGAAIPIKNRTLVGSQTVPYIFEDYVSCDDVVKGIKKIQELDEKQKIKLSDKVLRYARENFSIEKTVDEWHESMLDAIEKWKKRTKKWDYREF